MTNPEYYHRKPVYRSNQPRAEVEEAQITGRAHEELILIVHQAMQQAAAESRASALRVAGGKTHFG